MNNLRVRWFFAQHFECIYFAENNLHCQFCLTWWLHITHLLINMVLNFVSNAKLHKTVTLITESQQTGWNFTYWRNHHEWMLVYSKRTLSVIETNFTDDMRMMKALSTWAIPLLYYIIKILCKLLRVAFIIMNSDNIFALINLNDIRRC